MRAWLAIVWVGVATATSRNAVAQSTLPPIVVTASPAAAPTPEVRRGYVGATFSAGAGGGVEGLAITSLGGELFAGARLSRWISIEGFFAYQFAMSPVREPIEGAPCSGTTNNNWNWQLAGARFWVHVVHSRYIDVSVGPSVGVGFSEDRHRSLLPMAESCFSAPQDFVGWAFEGGIATALELRPAPWFGVRVMGQTSILMGGAGDEGFGALSLSAWAGPVFRF